MLSSEGFRINSMLWNTHSMCMFGGKLFIEWDGIVALQVDDSLILGADSFHHEKVHGHVHVHDELEEDHHDLLQVHEKNLCPL